MDSCNKWALGGEDRRRRRTYKEVLVAVPSLTLTVLHAATAQEQLQ